MEQQFNRKEMRMKIFIWILLTSLAPFLLAKDPLKLDVISIPQNCTSKSKNGDVLTIHYIATLADSGKRVDSSLERNEPFVFQLGNGEVIEGLDKGLRKMCPGEKRRLTIPAQLAYGSSGAGNIIPGGATLIFDVTLVNISHPQKAVDYNDEQHFWDYNY